MVSFFKKNNRTSKIGDGNCMGGVNIY